MDLLVRDFNGASQVFEDQGAVLWDETRRALREMPLHLKASDQQGLQGNPIFDVVGTNEAIKAEMARQGWRTNIPIPSEFKFLGTDVDFAKSFVLTEVQFSNYPFLLNNIMRSELFFKSKTEFDDEPVRAVIIVTKGKMFPASNSTLYFEQAVSQTEALAANGVFDVPMRVVGLVSPVNEQIPVVWTSYHAARYSRTPVSRVERKVVLTAGRSVRSRHSIGFDEA